MIVIIMILMMMTMMAMMAMMMIMITEGPEAAVPAGHHDPVVAGEHREPVPSGHPGDRLALQGLDAGGPRSPVLHLGDM